MRFGLNDLDELPSLKEFEALAREALGTEDGIAEGPPEADAAGTASANSEAAADAAAAAPAGTAGAEPPVAEATNADAASPAGKAAGGSTR